MDLEPGRARKKGKVDGWREMEMEKVSVAEMVREWEKRAKLRERVRERLESRRESDPSDTPACFSAL